MAGTGSTTSAAGYDGYGCLSGLAIDLAQVGLVNHLLHLLNQLLNQLLHMPLPTLLMLLVLLDILLGLYHEQQALDHDH